MQSYTGRDQKVARTNEDRAKRNEPASMIYFCQPRKSLAGAEWRACGTKPLQPPAQHEHTELPGASEMRKAPHACNQDLLTKGGAYRIH